MIKSLKKDIQLLTKILQNQQSMIDAMKRFGCTENNLDTDKMVFDLCAFYMAQIGEDAKLLTDETKDSFKLFDADITKYFRNMIDHDYEKIDRKVLKAYIISMISKEMMAEIRGRIQFCIGNTK